ncbi:fasciclin domain-containing protein [Colletotrichum orchidophilum]|uniref:Fasciclin domain-containing protein n=1 Tax=Colletotrichum orchidophilum TaxID=1209926 RepID=A0A1G4B1M5_9PEZI|nr:fasciclin domain-containing protein [Colletotrichum orchidophilum]OHE95320.1 fasciclin domain-containing protein [Colletotrichum orchidophilum]
MSSNRRSSKFSNDTHALHPRTRCHLYHYCAAGFGCCALLHPRQAQQSLSIALSADADLSKLHEILNSNPRIKSNITSGTNNKVTLLVPTNDVSTQFVKHFNISEISQLPVSQLLTVFQYHILHATFTATNFSAPRGITVPTKLRDELYNLRSPDPAIINQKSKGTSSDDHASSLRGGLSQTVELIRIDGVRDGGSFQSIDTVLEAPKMWSTTIKKLSSSLSVHGDALDTIKLWKQLEKTSNITCLGPNSALLKEAGSPQSSLRNEDLKTRCCGSQVTIREKEKLQS